VHAAVKHRLPTSVGLEPPAPTATHLCGALQALTRRLPMNVQTCAHCPPPAWLAAGPQALRAHERADLRPLPPPPHLRGALQALKRRLPMSVETCAHYLTFAGEEVADGDTRFKCAPPLRSAANRDDLLKGEEGEASTHPPRTCPPPSLPRSTTACP
jgi:hypothetical protein